MERRNACTSRCLWCAQVGLSEPPNAAPKCGPSLSLGSWIPRRKLFQGASNEKAATQVAAFSNELVEAAGIEPACPSIKSNTYRRNTCLRGASRTFASCWNASHGHPPRSTQIRRGSVSCSPLLPAETTIGYRLRGTQASDRPEPRPPPITREGLYK